MSAPSSRLVGLLLALAACIVGYITWWTLQDMLFSLEIEEVARSL